VDDAQFTLNNHRLIRADTEYVDIKSVAQRCPGMHTHVTGMAAEEFQRILPAINTTVCAINTVPRSRLASNRSRSEDPNGMPPRYDALATSQSSGRSSRHAQPPQRIM
jgi:hypothetical protein